MITLVCEVCGQEFTGQRRREHPRCGSGCRARATEAKKAGHPVVSGAVLLWRGYRDIVRRRPAVRAS